MFEVGDVVTLRSGGPWMTVAQLNGSEIGCVWFDGSGESLRREYFPAECLKKVVDEP